MIPINDDIILSVRDLETHLVTRRGTVKGVDGVSFDLHRGETLGLVGESGSGKSMTALSIIRLVPYVGRIVGGEVILNGVDLLKLSGGAMREVRGSRIAMVLQDPLTSLNPVFRVGDQVGESVRLHQSKGGNVLGRVKERVSGLRERGVRMEDVREWALDLMRRGKRIDYVLQRVIELLRQVRIPAAESAARYYPHQMSGGMRQRAVGAIGIAATPEILIADEPTSALDPTIQAQYLELLGDLQKQYNLAILFITHDFGIVANLCDSVAVMYGGRIVEYGPVREVFRNPAHPYTEALLSSVPRIEEKADRLPSITGQPPAPMEMPPGCHFAPRCPYVFERCSEFPSSFPVAEGHVAKCWLVETGAPRRTAAAAPSTAATAAAPSPTPGAELAEEEAGRAAPGLRDIPGIHWGSIGLAAFGGLVGTLILGGVFALMLGDTGAISGNLVALLTATLLAANDAYRGDEVRHAALAGGIIALVSLPINLLMHDVGVGLTLTALLVGAVGIVGGGFVMYRRRK